MFNWLKKHKILVCLLSIVIILGVPLVIHILFKINSGIPFFEAEWTAGEALGYYGSILSFVGTVVLGALALYQNRIIKEESDKRESLLEQREYEKNIPKFTAISQGTSGNCSHLNFAINNVSENVANAAELYDIKILSPENGIYWESEKNYSFDIIPPMNSVKVKLENPNINRDGYTFSIKMKCTDKYNEIHKYMIIGTYFAENCFPKFKIEEIK